MEDIDQQRVEQRLYRLARGLAGVLVALVTLVNLLSDLLVRTLWSIIITV